MPLATVSVLRVDSHAARFALREAGNADVSIFAVSYRPRVADDPVGTEGVFAVADHLDSVIERNVLGIVASSENTRFVIAPVTGIGGNRERTSEGESIHNSTGVVGLDSGVTAGPNLGEILPERALEVFTKVALVRVGPFLVKTREIRDCVDTELCDRTAAATSASAIVGVNDARSNLLLREDEEFAGNLSVSGFDGFSCRVCPT